ncbi:MAG: hypothetical protein HKM93_08925 [Desulfobacteraceae bacterium]|nr:hypothetical protein [Desulfobacteraceae bacterium]
MVFGINLGGSSSKKKTSSETWNWSPGQREVADKLEGYFDANQPGGSLPKYKGDFVAGPSRQENQALNKLNTYMGGSGPQQWNWANKGVKNALNQNYKSIVDPGAVDRLYGATRGRISNDLNPGSDTGAGGRFDTTMGRINTALKPVQSMPVVDGAATDALFERIKRRTLNEDLPELQNSLAENANTRGMYFSGKHGAKQNDLIRDTGERLMDKLAEMKYGDEQMRRSVAREREGRSYNTIADLVGRTHSEDYNTGQMRENRSMDTMADLIRTANQQGYQDERERRDVARGRENRSFSAIPLAMDIGRQQFNLPLEQAQAGFSLGGLPRLLNQASNDAGYQEFLRTQSHNNPAIAQMLQYLATQGYGKTTNKSKSSSGSAGISIGL